jgi:hypothetical protein
MFQVKHISRRRFLTFVGLGTGVFAAGALLAQRGIGLFASLRSRIYGSWANPGLEAAPQGVLGDDAIRALLSTVEALVDTEVEVNHYEVFFRWRSENLSGYRALYDQFADILDRAAKEAGKPDFSSCDMEVQREILQKPSRRYALVFDRDWLRFEKYIFQQILALFSETDAWILLGYESWPGTPRGLDSYTRAPHKAR